MGSPFPSGSILNAVWWRSMEHVEKHQAELNALLDELFDDDLERATKLAVKMPNQRGSL